jgi:hypothetical protein
MTNDELGESVAGGLDFSDSRTWYPLGTLELPWWKVRVMGG